MPIEQKCNYIFSFISQPFIYLLSFCKRKYSIDHVKETGKILEKKYIDACINGQLFVVQKAIQHFLKQSHIDYQFELSRGLQEAVKSSQYNIVEYLLEKGDTNNLDENLKIACINNNIGIAELLVKKGANVIVGLRVAKSPNITKMLYRYRQNSTLINY
jgi:hypothetical protein